MLNSKRLEVLLLLLLPFFVSALSTNWLYTGITIDSWAYYGHFLNPTYLIQHIPSYSASRLGLLVPGIVLNLLFSPLLANAVLRFGFFYLAVFSLYGTVRILLHHRVAFITSFFMGSYFPFLASIGWNYVDGAVLSYLMASIFGITLTANYNLASPTKAESKRLFMVFLASGAATLMLHSNIVAIIFAPLLVLYFLALSYRSIPRESWGKQHSALLRSIITAVVGILFTTALLGVLNLLLGGNFLFFGASLNYASQNYGSDDLQTWRDGSSLWFLNRPYLSFSIVIFFTSIVILFQRIRTRTFEVLSTETILLGWVWGMFALYLGVYLLTPLYIVQVPFYVAFTTPGIFLGAAVMFDRVLGRSKLDQIKIYWFIIAIVILNLGHISARWRALSMMFSENYSLLLPLVSFLAAFLLIYRVKSTVFSLLMLALVVSYGNYRSISSEANHTIFLNDFYDGNHTAALTTAIADSVRTIQAHSNGEYVWIWYNQNENLAYIPVASAYMYLYSLVGNEFPVLFDHITLYPNMLLVLLGTEGNALLQAANEQLRNQCYSLEPVHTQLIEHDAIHFQIIITRTTFIAGCS